MADDQPRPAPSRRESQLVDELTRANHALRMSEARVRGLFEHAAMGVALIDVAGHARETNPALQRMLGYSAEELLRLSWRKLIHPDDMPASAAAFRKLVAREYDHYEIERRFLRRDGSALWAQITVSGIWEGDALTFLVETAVDVTERRQALAALRASEERFRTLATNAPVGIFETDADWNCTYVNEPWCEMTGLTPEQARGRGWVRVLPPEDWERFQHEWAPAVYAGEPTSDECRFVAPDGRLRWVWGTIVPRHDDTGATTGFVATIFDITARKHIEEELVRAREAALAASRAKSRFLANMSHDIRTPINAIMGMTEMALDSDLTTDQRQQLETVRDSARNLLGILNDILDISRVEAGKLALRVVPFDPRAPVDEAVQTLAGRAHAKRLELAATVAPDVPRTVAGDPLRLQQILVNLIGNAVKFTSAGSISVRVEAGRSDEIHFSVADTGIGIRADQRERVFDAFTQGDQAPTQEYGGTGLGLAICRQLVELMNGRIWVESELGRGSTFHVTVPLPAACAADRTPPRPPGAAPRPDVPERPLRLLVAEDNPVNRQVAVRMLAKLGHTVKVVENGRLALEEATQHRFDAVLMDVQMPEMDGLAATRAIRSAERETGDHVPIIALTAHVMSGDAERCLAAGMDAHLPKPIDLGSLREALAALARVPTTQTAGGAGAAPAPDPDAAASPVDLEAVLDRLGGDRDIVHEVIGALLREVPKLLSSVRSSAEAHDAPGLARAAHSLRGALLNVGATAAALAALDVERIGQAGDLARAEPACATLAREVGRATAALRGFVERHPAARVAQRVRE
jgi:PAS domain S-box-containing protein